MADGESGRTLFQQRQLAVLLLVGGLGLIAASLLWPKDLVSRSAWSADQARRYQEASARLHELSHAYANEARRREGDAAEIRRELDQAQGEYDGLRSQLETAIERPRYAVWLMRVGGVLLTAIGAAALLIDLVKGGRETR